jgi:hypothetical protein
VPGPGSRTSGAGLLPFDRTEGGPRRSAGVSGLGVVRGRAGGLGRLSPETCFTRPIGRVSFMCRNHARGAET